MKDQKAYAKIIAKAWNDPKFKEKLLKNPEAVLKENGIEIPKGEKIQVHENTSKIMHLVIPQKPTGELSLKDLEAVAAAGKHGGGCNASVSCK
jgi:Nitrile hydratase, alpha chain